MGLKRHQTEDAARILRSGGVLLLKTDTLPGLHCRADDEAAVRRIFALKNRSSGKPLLVLAGSLEQAREVLAPLSDKQLVACRSCWPGPFSLILPTGAKVTEAVSAGLATLAVRVPGDAALRDLIAAVGAPLVSTSANRAGADPAQNLADAEADFGGEVDGSWGNDQTDASGVLPSALVDLSGDEPRVLREGPLPFPKLSL